MYKERMIYRNIPGCLALLLILGCTLSARVYPDSESAAGPSDQVPFPDGYRVALNLDCGGDLTTVTADTLNLSLFSGEAYAFPDIKSPEGTVFFDTDRVVFELSGLNPEKEYVLGFTMWDGDNQDRVQSVQFSAGTEDWQTVLPPVRAAAFSADKPVRARVLLPLAAPFAQKEKLRIAFVKEAGPNAVVSEMWLLERISSANVKRVLIVTGDDYTGHDWCTTAPALAKVLREDKRLEVSITESPAILGSPLLSHYDALVIHFKNYADRLPLGRVCGEGLRDYVAGGRGLVLSHFGCGAFQEWDGFVNVAGRVWNPALRAHDPHGVFTVRIADRDHPVTAGMADFEVRDELYTCLDGSTPLRVLCEATSVVDKKAYPMAFTVENTGGRVFHCVLGHDASVYENPDAGALFRRGTLWAAGLDTGGN